MGQNCCTELSDEEYKSHRKGKYLNDSQHIPKDLPITSQPPLN